MKLGKFSVSLAVKDIHVSFDFYKKLGFEQIAGDIEQNWIILNHGVAFVGLFQGMFEENLMTFNPEDARGIQKALEAQGIEIEKPTEGDSGPAHFTLLDPDGNRILVDQHE